MTQPYEVLPITVVVPARNEAARIRKCLLAIRANAPAEIILVDGSSTDDTRELAEDLVDRIIIDAGNGPGAARQLGAEAAANEWIGYIDADVDLPETTLRVMWDEVNERNLDGLQAGLRSVGGGDFWSEELAWHHNHGRSRGWFGFSAALIRRELVVRHPFDHRLQSGEDIDLRYRLVQGASALGVSEHALATHRFAQGFPFAKDQFLADGAGLGRLVRKYGLPALPYAFIPFAAAVRGFLRGLRHPLGHGLYFLTFALGNFVGLSRGLFDPAIAVTTRGRRALLAVTQILLVAIPLLGAGVLIGVLLALTVVVPPLASLARASLLPAIVTVLAVGGMVALEIVGSLPEGHPYQVPRRRVARSILVLALVAIAVSSLRLIGILIG